MNKKIIVSITAATLIATSVFASCQTKDMGESCKTDTSSCKMMMKKNKFSKKHGTIAHMAMMLDLSDEQKTKIEKIIQASQLNRPSQSAAFTNNSFDKKKFINISKEKRELKIKNKADTIEKIYALLNESQKKDFKKFIDMRESMRHNMKNKMMKKGSCNDKNCNGRG